MRERCVPILTEAGRQRPQHVEREITMVLLAAALELPAGVYAAVVVVALTIPGS